MFEPTDKPHDSSSDPSSYYRANREKRCEYQRKYYQSKKEEIQAKRQAKEKANPAIADARLAYNRAYYLKNRERLLQQRKERYRKLVQANGSASKSDRQSEIQTTQPMKNQASTSSSSPSDELLRGALTSLAKSVLSLRQEIAHQRTHLAQLEERDGKITHFLTQIFEDPTSEDNIDVHGEKQNDAA